MTTHTPGRWKLFGRDGKPLLDPDCGWTIKGPDGKSIAACTSSVNRSSKEKFYNGLLMKAAPTLLEACVQARAAMPDAWAAVKCDVPREVLALLDEAIAAATGEAR